MPNMETPLIPQLQIQRRDVPPHPADPFRNMLTYQGAIIRGENTVVLNNADSLTPDMAERIRTFIPANHRPSQPRKWPFNPYRDPREDDFRERGDVREVIPDQMWEGFELEWIKILGEGGFGLATLWRAYYEDDSFENVVIKIPHSTDIRGEADWHLRYGGASHIVQFLDIQEKARDVRQQHFPGEDFQWEEEFDWETLNVIMLEYAEYGNVYEMMQKVSFFNITFPNRCLWEIWECLVKGVASAAWQPHLAQNDDPSFLDRALKTYDDQRMTQYSDFLNTLPMTHDVHFDLEEQNILIAYDSDHDYHPIFKLHDFGDYSHKMRACWRDWPEKEYWRCRKTPKKNRMAPETFSADWDEVVMGSGEEDFKGEDLSKGHPIAGRYGTWTNLFHIGQVMESIITKVYGFHPMVGKPYSNADGTLTDKTYGWRLMRPAYNEVDRELKDLILQCMYEKPSSRPSLDYLLRKIGARKARGFDESADEVKRFWENLATLRRDSDTPPPPYDDDDDDDDGGPPPDLSHGDDDHSPSDPKTLADSHHSGLSAMTTAHEEPQFSHAQQDLADNRPSSTSVRLGSPVTSGTAVATSVMRDSMVKQFTSMPGSSETYVTCSGEPEPSSVGGKRKLHILDDDFPDKIAVKRTRMDGEASAAGVGVGGGGGRKKAQLWRGMRQRLARMMIR